MEYYAQARGCKTKLKQFRLGTGTVLCPKLDEDQKKDLHFKSERFFFATEFSLSSESN